MAMMPAIMGVATLATTALGTLGSIRQGQAEAAAAQSRARQLEHQAAQETAAGQHAVEEKRRQAQILQSRALAAAGASGAGTLDSNVLNMISGIAEQSELDIQREKFATTERANRALQGAASSRFEGKLAKRASKIRAVGTAFEGLTKAGTQMGFGR